MLKRLALLAIFLGVVVGAAVGLGGYTFIYAKGASYLTNDARACANCHVMQDYLDGWAKSSHHAVATCNDCHTPHDFIGKYATKMSNGYHHSLAFTTGNFHEPIQITPRNRRITENTCRSCHADIVTAIEAVHRDNQRMSCVRCHSSVGHMR